jgi:PA domain-containing protein
VTFNGRDILAVNNEPCAANGVGGFDLYDVTNPANPVALVQGAGDQSPDTPFDNGHADVTQDPTAVPNSAHSIFLWQNNGKLFAVIVDNTELHDVDIFDVTDPTEPEFIADVDLVTLADEQGFDLIDNSANGDAIFHHDMVVKRIGNVQTMLVSYWDAGYVKLNVNDPANPRFIGDSAFDDEDPLVDDPRTPAEDGFAPPEGNGHQAEFSHDNEFVLAADEDFGPHRFEALITDGPFAGFNLSATQGSAVPLLGPERPLVGDTKYVGEACTAAAVDPPNGVPIALVARGTCSFQEKYDAVEAAGYEAGIVFNSNSTVNGCETLLTMLAEGDSIPFLFVSRNQGMRLLGLFDQATYKCTPGNNAETFPANPAPPQDSAAVSFLAHFDGWGYTHLYRNVDGGGLEAVDHFAIEESLDERYFEGFGDLSVHEFATDPDVNVAYSAYYAGGMRVFEFGDGGLEQTGKFIDEGGNNFWGVEVVTTSQGERLFAGSDRDFGLYLLRYTGPGAVPKPSPQGGGQAPPPVTAQSVMSDPQIPGQNLRVTKKRYVRVPVSCPETVGGDCRGHLTIERRNGWHTLSQRWFTKDADQLSSVRLRIARPEFRRLVARGRQRVSVELISRGSDGVLRHAEQHLTLLAPPRGTARG